jgi:hypothetical protein
MNDIVLDILVVILENIDIFHVLYNYTYPKMHVVDGVFKKY